LMVLSVGQAQAIDWGSVDLMGVVCGFEIEIGFAACAEGSMGCHSCVDISHACTHNVGSFVSA